MIAIATARKPSSVQVRKAKSGRDRITAVSTYEEIESLFEYDLDTESIYDEEELDYGAIRVFTSGESATVHFFPDEELKNEEFIYGLAEEDAEARPKYRENMEHVYELFGGEKRVGELLEKL